MRGPPGSGSDDITLLRRIAAGMRTRCMTLHKRYVNLVYSMAWRVLQDVGRAEEVTQDIFIKLWQKGHQFDPAGTLFKLAAQHHPLCRDRPPAQRWSPPGGCGAGRGRGDDQPTLEQMLPPTDHASWERGQHLRLLLAQLPANQRQIIELAYFAGLTHSELAEYLGLPLGTVKSRLRLGLEKLRGLWLDEPGMKQ